MAGYLRAVAVVQAVLFVPSAMFYWHWFDAAPTLVYQVLMIGLWAGLLTLLIVWRSDWGGRVRSPPCSQAIDSAPA